ncbi:MAG: redox-sensing transcriptional repressor Rex [Phycisphaerae bacterium]|jgi:redox-sensing transcriptional repressor
MRYRNIPSETIRRLPIYLRALHILKRQNKTTISSSGLSEIVAVNSWQVRKDFSYFGAFGKRGSGYDIDELAKQISKILKLHTRHRVALVGVGNLGSAVLAYPGFEPYGFDIVTAYESDSKKIGKKIHGVIVEDISNLKDLRKDKIDLALIAVPESAAQQIAEQLVKAGVKGILNFSPRHIQVPKRIKVFTIDIAMDLARLPFYIA